MLHYSSYSYYIYKSPISIDKLDFKDFFECNTGWQQCVFYSQFSNSKRMRKTIIRVYKICKQKLWPMFNDWKTFSHHDWNSFLSRIWKIKYIQVFSALSGFERLMIHCVLYLIEPAILPSSICSTFLGVFCTIKHVCKT